MKQILIADNSEEECAKAKAVLEDQYCVTCAENGERALALLREGSFDLAIISAELPGGGLELMAEIHEDSEISEIPVVIIGREDVAETECRCLEQGAVDYFLTSFSAIVIRSRIGRILETEELRRQLADQLQEKIREVGEIRKKAQQDALTGLWDRKYIENKVNSRIERGKKGALFMIDMDNFKVINDLYGHITGDNVLREFADTMRICAGPDDVLCRIGGDEFVMVMDRDNSRRDLGKLADGLIADLEEKLAEQGLETHSSVSIGISLFPEDGHEFSSIYNAADKALYYVKQNGKHSHRFYNERRKGSAARGAGNAVDLRYVQQMMDRSDDGKGAALLDMDGFKHVYHFLHRFSTRAEESFQVVLFTAWSEGMVDPREVDAALDLLTQSIQKLLRRSDVSTRFSSRQVVTILVGTNGENADMVAERILEDFGKTFNGTIKIEYDIAEM